MGVHLPEHPFYPSYKVSPLACYRFEDAALDLLPDVPVEPVDSVVPEVPPAILDVEDAEVSMLSLSKPRLMVEDVLEVYRIRFSTFFTPETSSAISSAMRFA